MENVKKVILKLLYPHPITAILTILSATPGLIFVFTQKAEGSFYAPVIYAFSFYALCIVVANSIPVIKRIKKVFRSNKHTNKYLSEADLRARISMHTGIVINIGFAIFKLVAGIYYNSNWFIQIAVYYTILSIIRFMLINRDRKTNKLSTNQLIHQWKTYRLCGGLLFVLNITISIMVLRMIWQDKGFSYPGLVIYAIASYTFYRLIITIIRLVKHKHNNPILLAAKALDLSISLMSLFSLQTAMFSSFGGDTTEETRHIMNIFTGCAVCFSVVCIATIMIIKADKNIKYISREEHKNEE